MTPKVSKRD